MFTVDFNTVYTVAIANEIYLTALDCQIVADAMTSDCFTSEGKMNMAILDTIRINIA